MSRWRPPPSPSLERARRTAAAIARDELPPDVVRRARAGGPATSSLSVADAAALASIGGAPLALVSGASVLRPLHQPMPSPTPSRATRAGTIRELSVRSHGWNVARGRALRRLRQEAELSGATAVVGVALRRAERSHEDVTLVEVVATGTAVRLPHARGLALTTLSGADVAALAGAGWAPVDLVAASTVCYVVSGRETIDRVGLTWAQGGTNSEYGDWTAGVYATRSRAIGRVEGAAKAAGAAGVVGLTWEQRIEPVRREGFGTRDLEVTLHVAASAIARAGEPDASLSAAVVDLA